MSQFTWDLVLKEFMGAPVKKDILYLDGRRFLNQDLKRCRNAIRYGQAGQRRFHPPASPSPTAPPPSLIYSQLYSRPCFFWSPFFFGASSSPGLLTWPSSPGLLHLAFFTWPSSLLPLLLHLLLMFFLLLIALLLLFILPLDIMVTMIVR